MLVLTRKNEEKLYIGDDIIITVLSNQGKYVKIGIEAPKDIPIYRKEIITRLSNEISDKN